MDVDDGYVLWTGIWKGVSLDSPLTFELGGSSFPASSFISLGLVLPSLAHLLLRPPFQALGNAKGAWTPP